MKTKPAKPTPRKRKINLANFGSAVEAKREKLGFTQAQCAERSGMPQPHWARIESGGRIPNLRTAVKVAEALGCSLDSLIS